jgi:hypothetical protein
LTNIIEPWIYMFNSLFVYFEICILIENFKSKDMTMPMFLHFLYVSHIMACFLDKFPCFHFRDESCGWSAQKDSNKCHMHCSCCIYLFGLNLLCGPGRDGHGDEWRTSCWVREVGTTKKIITGQLKHMDHASVYFSTVGIKDSIPHLYYFARDQFC